MTETVGAGIEVTELRESWTLVVTPGGSWELVSSWQILRPQERPREVQTRTELSAELHPVRLHGLPLGNLESIACEFGDLELRCAMNGQRPTLDVHAPYDLYQPLPWFLGSIVRRAVPETGKSTPLKLVIMDRGGPRSELGLGAFDGHVRFHGEESITIGGKNLPALKYELQAEPFGNWQVYVTAQGIPAMIEDSKGRIRGELSRFEINRPWSR